MNYRGFKITKVKGEIFVNCGHLKPCKDLMEATERVDRALELSEHLEEYKGFRVES